jgi:hypothetical protein
MIKLITEDNVQLSAYKKSKAIEDYETKGIISLPEGVVVKSIQTLPAQDDVYTTIIIIGRR